VKCPHCSADMNALAFDSRGWPWKMSNGTLLGDILVESKPTFWRIECPNCNVSGPRQSTKQGAEDALRRMCGQSQEA